MKHFSYYCERRPRWLVITGFVLLGILAAVFFAFVFGYFVMLLWNWLMPGLFGLGTITYLQAFGIIILARLVFGNIGHRHSDRKDHSFWKHHRDSDSGEERNGSDKCLSKWKHYDAFWKEEGKDAFERFVQNKENKGQSY